MTAVGFDSALAGDRVRMLRSDGQEVTLAVQRWRRRAAGEDTWLLDRCTGATIDLGCGPGRLVAALADRGVPVLGVDLSSTAAAQCRRRRAAVVLRDLFGPLPDEGYWKHVLLADGNIGIGGDPARLLSRARDLLRHAGTVLVETDASPDAWWRGTARLRSGDGDGVTVDWAVLGGRTLAGLAPTVGLHVSATYEGVRCFTELTRS